MENTVSTNYPENFDSFEENVDYESVVTASDMNNVQSAIVAIEKTLGQNPNGEYNTLSERLDASIGYGADLQANTITISSPTSSIIAAGSAYISNTIYASAFIGDGSQLTGLPILVSSDTLETVTSRGNATSTELILLNPANSISASGNITSSKTIQASAFKGDGSQITGIPAAHSIDNFQDVTTRGSTSSAVFILTNPTDSISASGNITSSKTIQASAFKGDGSQITGVPAANSIDNLQDVTGRGSTSSSTLVLTNPTDSISASGNITSSKTIQASAFVGDGSQITGVPAANSIDNLQDVTTRGSSSSAALVLTNPTDSISASGNITSSKTIQASAFKGDGSQITGVPLANSIDSLQDVTTRGNTSSDTLILTNSTNSISASGNITSSKTIQASAFKGDGNR